jgi:hypothetical protein
VVECFGHTPLLSGNACDIVLHGFCSSADKIFVPPLFSMAARGEEPVDLVRVKYSAALQVPAAGCSIVHFIHWSTSETEFSVSRTSLSVFTLGEYSVQFSSIPRKGGGSSSSSSPIGRFLIKR